MTGNGHWRRVAIWLLSSSVAILALPAGAVTRAWLDRDSIDAGDAVTLNIETDQRGAEPDYSPLRGGFGLGAKNANQQMQVTNGSVTIRALFGVVITPRQTGEIIVPAIRVGNERTEPLRLQVVATAVDAGAPGPLAQARRAATKKRSSKPRWTTRNPTCSRAWVWWCGCITPPSWPLANWICKPPMARRCSALAMM